MTEKVGELIVKIKSDVDECTFEKVEDLIRDLLEKHGLEGEILCSVTGNTTLTIKEDIGKKEEGDITIRGELILGEKIWFNDDLRCRLRICGFSKSQIKELRNAKFVDLTITDYGDIHGVDVYVRQFGNEGLEIKE